MGAAISARLIDSGCTVLTPLSGRSEASRARAKAAGVQDVSLEDIINGHDVDWILSILPPNLAQSFAEDVTRVLYAKIADDAAKSAIPRIPVFVDCNAVNPKTAQFIARLFEPTSEHPSIPFIDASIIGGPPGENYDPTIYASSDPSSLSEAFRDFGRSHGLKITTLTGEGTGVGSASALKMSYAGITKGLIGIFTTMVLSAHASSPGTMHALVDELTHSQETIVRRMTRSLPDMLPKAYRFEGEMEEIAGFVGESDDTGMADIYNGIAKTYAKVAKSVESQDTESGEEDGSAVSVLKDFVERAIESLAEK
ncbi:hypothetical protein BOTBODRAFT_133584 [Botryobasidium botryosum FD-172 SS1]|uniref:Phosphogluconate dehydrogenase NAD-binding putative C-terminal domain-containing protein n=1 Tax=Botryobasidium botryosum (strain FD-172 SS1) TaxID=930990 RepID=A0A067MC89_BOTB1|nr:hypothetical protein BOTBODRAFT_133584 [Botryobasidium botryosum FD-172 SS1]